MVLGEHLRAREQPDFFNEIRALFFYFFKTNCKIYCIALHVNVCEHSSTAIAASISKMLKNIWVSIVQQCAKLGTKIGHTQYIMAWPQRPCIFLRMLNFIAGL